MGEQDEDQPVELSSSPCSLHDIDPAYAGLGPMNDQHGTESLTAWRKQQRKLLIEARMAVPTAQREEWSACIRSTLANVLGDVKGKIVSAYWPFRGEPELRPLLRSLRDSGTIIALPVVVSKGQPLIFREWKAGAKLARGVWNIPYPDEGPELVPDIAIAPVVGFDPPCFRLGYGGGFFDRTMEKHHCAPRLLGVGYDMQAIADIRPQPHDIAMQMVVTQSGVHRPAVG